MQVVFEFNCNVWTHKEMVNFPDDADTTEIEEEFSEWVKDRYRASWMVADGLPDAYADAF